MEEIKNSSVLDILINYAKNIGNKSVESASAERFIVAVCDFVDGSFSIDEPNDNSKENLNQLLTKIGVDIEKLKNNLLIHINEENASLSFMDGLYLQKKALEAKSKAQKKNISSITPELLLECVLSDPTDAIKNSIKGDAVSSGEITDAKAEAIRHILEDRFDKLFASEEEKTESKEVPTVHENETTQSIESLTERVKEIRDKLSEVVFGQDNAINVFSLGYFQAEMRSAIDFENKCPAATFLFAGAPGVGKTFLAKQAAGLISIPRKEFDMSGYADDQSYMDLIGFGANYKAPKEGLLTGFVKKNPKCVLIFDEIEKAHITTIHLFLQILDSGHLKDEKTGEEVSFNQTIIIFTTNAGKELYSSSESGDFSCVSRKVILRAIQKEVNPLNGQPFFPAAICSRFATGNVVMFNNMTAASLCDISRAETKRFIENFKKKYDVSVSVGNNVYAALLFSEGGTADARTIKSRSERFFDDEMFELFRFISADGENDRLKKLKSINIDVNLPKNQDIVKLFADRKQSKIVLFSSNPEMTCGTQIDGTANIIVTHSKEDFKKKMKNGAVSFIIIDIDAIENGKKEYLNMEDISSISRDVFWIAREKYPDIPVFVLQHKDTVLNIEEQKSFKNNGVRGFIKLDADGSLPAEKVYEICELLHQQNSMRELAKSNSLLTFETGQTVSEDGEEAQITLFDFELSTAVDAEDTNNVMSNVSKPNVKFDQIIGAENAKEELRFFIDYLRDPKQFADSGLRAPKGVLLYGPPGTGKTMLAKATACEAGVTFISAEGNQFIKKYIGEGKDALHELFGVARKYSPAILFIDEFEAIAKERVGGDHSWANGEDVLTALLTEMDGFNTDITRPVFVLAATNFDIKPGSGKSLDQALLRRFDSKIYVDLPNKAERTKFIEKKISENRSFDISNEEKNNLVIRSTGMSLADLDSIFELSLRMAIRSREHKVTDQLLDEAFETHMGGEEKKWDVSQLERVARHEAGHAYLCWQSGETPSYLTIVARGNHGGYMQHDDNEGKAIYTKDELLAKIRTSLGGRASEIVYYGEKDGISTGASGDLASATSLAQQIICTYGMDDEFGLAVIDGQSAKMSELSSEVRAAVNKILDDQMKQAIRIITEGKEAIDALVSGLISKNHLTGNEIENIFRIHYTANISKEE